MALEIQQLLEDKNQMSPTFSGPSQSSSCLQVMSTSTVSSEQNLEPHPQFSRDLSLTPATPTQSQQMQQKYLTQTVAQKTSAIKIQEYFADHLQLGQEFQLANMSIVQESRASSKLEEPMVPVNAQEMIQNKPNLIQGNQGHHHLKSLNAEFTNLTHPMILNVDSVLPAHLPFFRPQVWRLLERHVKKWMHFQRWGLPRRVEDSLRQLVPDPILFGKIRKNLQFSSILNSTSKVTCDKIGTIVPHTWGSYISREPIQSIWVSEWSLIKPQQRYQYQQVQNHETLALSSPPLEVLSGFYLPPEGQTNDSENNLHQKYRQLFCGHPSLHSESLSDTFLSSEGLSKNKNISKPPPKDSLPFKGLSTHPLLPKTPPEIIVPSSPSSPNCVSPAEHQQAHIGVPFLTPAECKALEWHLLQRQPQFQRGLPAVIQRPHCAYNPMQFEPRDKAQAPETEKMSWPRKPISETLHFFPEHARRLLEFHFQKQLIRLRWGLPEKIQQSFQLLLSSADQQALSCSSTTLLNVSIPQCLTLKDKGDGDPVSPILAQMSIPVPHLFTQAKAILQSHIDSKCGQIHQGKVPCCVYSSWEGTVPGGLAVAPFPCVPQGQPLELQAASDPDLHNKVMPMAHDPQKQASARTVTEHPKLHQALSQGTIEKLEMTLRHKYLTFLSGLPALYSVALSTAMAPAVTSQSVATGMVPGPNETPKEPLAQIISLKDPSRRLGPCFQNGDETWADNADFQPEVQVEGITESVPLESQTNPAVPYSFKTHILSKLNFHLRKKVLEIKLGVPIKERQSRKLTAAGPQDKSSQPSLSSLSKQGSTVLQELPNPPDASPAPDSEWVHLKEHLASQLKLGQCNQKPASSKAVPPASTHRPSKISQPSGDMTEAQVLCVQVEASVNNPSLEQPWSLEPQSPSKGKGSAQIPTLAEKREDLAKPKAAGDLREGDARLGLSLTSAERHPDENQEPEEMFLNRKPQGSWRWTRSCHLVDLQQHSSRYHPQLKLSEPCPGVPGGKESEHDVQDHQRSLNVLKSSEIPKSFHPAAAQPSQGQPFLGQATQHKAWKGQILQGQDFQGQGMPPYSHQSLSLPKSGLINKMKSFLHCISAMTKGKWHVDPIFSAPGNVAKTVKENVEKSLAPTKSTVEKAKTDTPKRYPKIQSLPTDRPVGLASLDVFHSPHKKLQLCSQLHGSVSISGHRQHCPRHCPGVAAPPNQGTNPPISHLRNVSLPKKNT
ncbi:protein FAM205A isoform X2 [Fukomys damarensis]|nr:protein FAM205A isoform X2 [Fukomys damarensis]